MLRRPPFAPSLLICALLAAAAQAQTLRSIKTLSPRGEGQTALVLRAERVELQLRQNLVAEGDVELRRGDTLLRAPSLSYDQLHDEVQAAGPVRLEHLGNQATGHSLRLQLDAFVGELLDPSYRIAQTGGSGKAERLDFMGDKRIKAQEASYSSCPREGDARPDWELRTRSLDLDLARNEGVADGAVLHFLGTPILAAPRMSFPLGDQRKSGWLPPHVGADSRSGFEWAQPYYFDLAPNRDATLTPFLMTKRGFGADGEFRWLTRHWGGELNASLLPNDRVHGDSRWASHLTLRGEPWQAMKLRADLESVSDHDYWKDLRRRISSQTPRLLARDVQAEREFNWLGAHWLAYGRVQNWQVLQSATSSDQIQESPYQREPQLGLRLRSDADLGLLSGFLPSRRKPRLEGALELEYNRFTLPRAALPGHLRSQFQFRDQLSGGERVHALGELSLPVGDNAWWVTPRLRANAAHYRLNQPLSDGRVRAQRLVPSFSVDSGAVFERDTLLFGRPMLQSLEPRLLYVHTPYRAQDHLPNFDARVRDFNADSIYAEGEYTGIDRVADAQQLSFGAVSRWLDPQDGDERLRVGLVQRYQFRPQRVSAVPGSESSTVPGSESRRLSDLLLTAAAHLSTPWWADAALRYDPEQRHSVRTVLRARYQPGPFRTVSLAYRLARNQSEQLDLAWQWPLWGKSSGSGGSNSCQGRWYGAGRVQYSLRESRVTDSLVGLEYDAGCWVLRMGVERLSTGLTEANTRLMLQLELVGLSRLGSNALKVLRDNVPGYRPLASDSGP
ncbi:LPS-assembly protein [Inhella inkyongensis]|uniref:LPS-assembly protein LptD n=1 Tax=Inhella inkyongensis TaxID=392593 RepID=A0A840S391_9BURK|nr:LPS assembly protein LptD [Inhella inkyongensis]MBB5203040.1 LPS-assembly protein [Inhella inkyongensis]